MSAIPAIYPSDTVLVAAPRSYEADFRARVPRPLLALPADGAALVIAHETLRVIIRRDEALSTRVPVEIAEAIGKRSSATVKALVEKQLSTQR